MASLTAGNIMQVVTFNSDSFCLYFSHYASNMLHALKVYNHKQTNFFIGIVEAIVSFVKLMFMLVMEKHFNVSQMKVLCLHLNES